MRRIYILCLRLLLVSGYVNAQHYPPPTYHGIPKPIDSGKIYLRLNAMGLIDLLGGNISIGGEARLNKRLSITMDAGYIFYSTLYRGNRATGVILRPGARLYSGKNKNIFFDLQLHYKGVTHKVYDSLQKDLVNNVGTYEEYKKFQVRRRIYGGQILIGGKLFPSGNTRLFLEIYWGLGLRYKEEWLYHEEPNSGYPTGGSLFFHENILSVRKQTAISPAMPFGLRLVYAIP
ncbi:hypothetical protein A4H97_20190 [Niastella yeongjuensis]|uniref:DUF3575 domain-containing protein n=1 Tax=Niastella yeongjuensis TaxID=354355 RepID=A0A1V9FCB2_9BACT|nr:hypothetical protein [Niastella yeongjuensis]OQP55912.1 hypothetical protein A4H97_20190 [Niastella yeongjuensis]SEP27149.1 hypothetical protein SAMN05660816_05036 [Niastella yeongjuensis]